MTEPYPSIASPIRLHVIAMGIRQVAISWESLALGPLSSDLLEVGMTTVQ